MKRIVRVIALLLASTLGLGSSALAEPWSIPDTPQLGHHSITIDETVNRFRLQPLLETYTPTGSIYCSSFDDPGCAEANYFYMTAPLAKCDALATVDCVEGLAFTSANGSSEAQFVRYTSDSHPNSFSGDGRLAAKIVGLPTIWSAPDMPHSDGDLYMVVAGLQGGVERPRELDTSLYAHVFAVKPVPDPFFQGSIKYWGDHCTFQEDSQGRKIAIGCEGNGDSSCLVSGNDGTCYKAAELNAETKITLSLKLANEPVGWFHGRMSEPQIDVAVDSGVTRLKLSALPVEVPTFYTGSFYKDMTPAVKKYWDDCLPKGECSAGTRIANSNPTGQRDGNLRNVLSEEVPYGDRALRIISKFADEVNQTAVESPLRWAFRSLQLDRRTKIWECATKLDGLVGLVATNATVYADGAPEMASGTLDYKVGGLRYLEDGKTIQLGKYDLVMRSDLARCLYGFSKAPVSAQVQVVSESGDNVVATTVVSEREGWLKLAAYGFTFSEKEIKVKITQPQTRTLTAFSRTTTALTTKQKAEIRATVSKGAANTKFICTGIRLEGQPQALNTLVRKRAKAACDYAKSLNPKLSTFFQTKTTKAASFNGKVLVVSK